MYANLNPSPFLAEEDQMDHLSVQFIELNRRLWHVPLERTAGLCKKDSSLFGCWMIVTAMIQEVESQNNLGVVVSVIDDKPQS